MSGAFDQKGGRESTSPEHEVVGGSTRGRELCALWRDQTNREKGNSYCEHRKGPGAQGMTSGRPNDEGKSKYEGLVGGLECLLVGGALR